MPQINHEILSWAREEAGLSLSTAANQLGLKDTKKQTAEEKLASYETGVAIPSQSLLDRFSSKYQLPILAFYLNRAPAKPSRGEDFRSLPERIESSENFLLDTLLRDLKARQSTLKQALFDEEEADEVTLVGSCKLQNRPEAVAKRILKYISLDLQELRAQPSIEGAFKYLREKVEASGIYVLLKGNLGSHHTDISVEAFRGFALADKVAPFVVINDKDAKSAWSFTLAHELAHLALGRTGVSGYASELNIEQFCNRVASELILPESDFQQFSLSGADYEQSVEEISTFSSAMKVSSSHITYRLFLRGDIDRAKWQNLSKYFRDTWLARRASLKKAQKAKNKGPDYYVLRKYSLGGGLLTAVQRFMRTGTLSTSKAAMLLGVKPIKVHRLFD